MDLFTKIKKEEKTCVGVHLINDDYFIQTEVIMITPEIAETLLEKNISNRPVSKINLKRICDEMENGNWEFEGDAIRLDENGNLVNGQHRLLAIIKTGLSFEFLVITGLKPKSFQVMDVQKIRTGSDTLGVENIPNQSAASAATKFIWAFRNGKYSANRNFNRTLNNRETLKYYHELNTNGEFEYSVYFGKFNSAKSRIVNPTTVIGFHYLFSMIDKEAADTFIKKLCTGEMLESDSPINALRNQLIKAKTDDKFKLTQMRIDALMVMAWNKCREGKKAKNIKLPSDSSEYDFNIK